jgi:hypothetical protein
MQAAKDSFYMALRDRLAALNPSRTIVVDGESRPAIVVRENTEPHFTAIALETFYLDWRSVQIVEGTHLLVGLECGVWYASQGTSETGVDRGRTLSEMDDELLRICTPPYTAMRDYRQAPSVDLGAGLFWTMPEQMKEPSGADVEKQWKESSSGRLERQALVRVYFFQPEVGA